MLLLLFSIVFQNVIHSCDGEAEFSALLLQFLVSHDPLEIMLILCSTYQHL